MNEFKPHDYFKASDQGYVSRKVFIEHVRNSYDHMRELASLIKGYDQTIDTYLERWNQNLESLDDSIIGLLKEWIDDSTFSTIINEEIFKTKADKVDLENVTAQLQQIAVSVKDFGLYNNMENLNIIGNTVADMQVKTDGDSPHVSAPIIVDNRLLNSVILGNTFIDVVRTDPTNYNATWMRAMTLIKSNHYTLIVKDNSIINTGNYTLAGHLTDFIDIIEPVPDSNSIIVDNNSFINVTLSYLSPLYAKTRVKGLDGQRSNGALFNERNSYTGATLPADIPVGVTLSAQDDFMYVTYKLSSDPSFSNMTVQHRYSSADPYTFYTRLGQLNNTWTEWRYLTAAI